MLSKIMHIHRKISASKLWFAKSKIFYAALPGAGNHVRAKATSLGY